MRQSKSRLAKRFAVAAALALGGAVSVAALAQGTPPLAGILDALARLQNSIDALAAPKNVLFTSSASLNSGVADCVVVNVSSLDRMVSLELIDAGTGVSVFSQSRVLNPGKRAGIGIFAAVAHSVFCKFTVQNGAEEDIRASLNLSPYVGGDDTTSVSIEAH